MKRLFINSGIDNVQLAVEEFGNPTGSPVLLVHGFAQSYWCWKKQFFDTCLQNFRIIAFDLRGHGRSEKPIETAPYLDSSLWASDIASIIDELKLVRPIIVAWSYSGLVVCDYLRHYSDHFLGGINFVSARTKVGTLAANRMSGSLFLELAPGFCSENSKDRTIAVQQFLDNLTECKIADPDFYEMLGYNLSVPVEVCHALLQRSVDNDDVISNLKIPVLITHGDKDTSVLLSMANHNHSLIPGSQISVYKETGHAPFYENPEKFNLELARFVNNSVGA